MRETQGQDSGAFEHPLARGSGSAQDDVGGAAIHRLARFSVIGVRFQSQILAPQPGDHLGGPVKVRVDLP